MEFQTSPEARLGFSGKNTLFPFWNAVPPERPKEDFFIQHSRYPAGASLVAQMAKNLRAVQEARVPSLGREDPLEEAGQPTPSMSVR